MKDRYIVTGAAGHVGSTILRELKDRSDIEIYALVRAGGTKAKINSENIHYVIGNVKDRESLEGLFEGAEGDIYFIHCAAIISIQRKVSKEIYDVNVKGVDNVIDACLKHNVKKLVHVSSVHAIPDLKKGETMKEIYEFSPDAVEGSYAKTKAEACKHIMEAIKEKGLPAVMVFPSGIMGPYDEGANHLIQMCIMHMKGKLPASVKGGYDFVDVRDVATGCISALEKGKIGECYILSNYYIKMTELLDMISDYKGLKHLKTMPVWLAKFGAPFVEAYCKMKKIRPLYTLYSVNVIASNGHFSHEHATNDLGYNPRAMEEIVHDMCDYIEEVVIKPEEEAKKNKKNKK